MSRLLISNMDGEARWIGAGPLPRPLRERLAAVGTLMRAFASSDDDLLWTPDPIDPAVMLDVPGLRRPRLVSGVVPAHSPDPLLWMVTPGLWEQAAASREACAPEVVERVANRAFGFDVARRAGLAAEGAQALVSAEELALALDQARGPWVCKPAWSAAGRGHLLGDGPADADTRLAAVRLLSTQGWLLFEPWEQRVLDAGCCGQVRDGEVQLLGSHRLLIDGRGRFRGIAARLADDVAPGLTPDEQRALEAAALLAGRALAEAGYQGPFGVDAYRARSGAFRPLVELNARHSFGRLTRTLLASLEGLDPTRALALRMARGPAPAGEGRIPLLAPDPAHGEGGTSAWFEPWDDDEGA